MHAFRLICLSVLLGGFFMLTAAPVAAQENLESKVATVKVSGSARFTSDEIAEMTGLKPGDEVDKDTIQAAADRLAQLGFFQNVRFRFQGHGLDVDIEFQVEDTPALPVSFDNFPWFTDEELNKVLVQAIPYYDGTAPEQGTILDVMKDTLESALKTRGVSAVVECSPLGRPEGSGMMMQFRVVGASLKVGSVQFTDGLANDNKRVRERLDDLVGKAYSRFAVDMFVLEQVRPAYLEQGYLQVAFGEPQARFTGDPNKPLPDQVLVVIPVKPGPAFHWAGAEWSGTTAFGPDALDGMLGLGLGEVANGNRIQAALDHVRSEYGRLGYLDLDMDPQPVFSEAEAGGNVLHKVTYRIALHEGPQYHMGDMVITGLSLAAERKLLAAWRIQKGQVFDNGFFENLVAELERRKEAVFGDLPLHYDQVGRWLRKNTEDKTVDVLLDFK